MSSATRDDIKAILGNLDPDELLAIVKLQPSTAELEEAAMWLSGDRDVLADACHLH